MKYYIFKILKFSFKNPELEHNYPIITYIRDISSVFRIVRLKIMKFLI